jgi:hypothetical protein
MRHSLIRYSPFADSRGLPANSPILIPGHSSLPLGDRWSYFYDHH